MMKIIRLADLEKVSTSAARCIAEKELTQLFSLYQIENISCCGSIIVIESSAEFENFAAMGLTEPINRNFEFTEKYIFKKMLEHIEKPLIIQRFFVFLGFFNAYCPTTNISLLLYLRQTRTHKHIKITDSAEKPFPYHLKRKSDRKRLFFCIYERCFLLVKMNRLTPWCKTLKNLPLTPKSTKTALTENCNIFCDDVVFELGSVSPIKEDDKCVGYRVMIKVKYETILTSLSIPS